MDAIVISVAIFIYIVTPRSRCCRGGGVIEMCTEKLEENAQFLRHGLAGSELLGACGCFWLYLNLQREFDRKRCRQAGQADLSKIMEGGRVGV